MRKVTLTGHLGKDADVRFFDNGGEAMSFSLSVYTGKKGTDGKYISDWYSVRVSTSQINLLRDKLFKGTRVIVEGQLWQNHYVSKQGVKGVEMVVEWANVELQKEAKNQNNNNNYNQDYNNSYNNNNDNNSYNDDDFSHLSSDETPF